MIAASYWEVLSGILIILGTAVLLAATFGAWFYVVDEEGGPFAVLVAIITTVGFILALAWVITWVMNEEDGAVSDRSACEMAGGYWEQTGTRPVLVGKVIMMQPVYGCIMREG